MEVCECLLHRRRQPMPFLGRRVYVAASDRAQVARRLSTWRQQGPHIVCPQVRRSGECIRGYGEGAVESHQRMNPLERRGGIAYGGEQREARGDTGPRGGGGW